MRITPGAPSIQTLKAQQAWEARRAAKTTTTEKAPAAATPSIEIAKPSLEAAPTAATNAAISPQWNRKVQEIQHIAEKAGFIGVSEQDIRQAYMQGSSLLADYRV